jgi:hypothetical protein
MSNAGKPLDLALGGWQVSGITTIQHGVPLAVSDGTSNNGGLNSGFNNRANYITRELNTTCWTAQSAAFGVVTGTSTPRQLQLGVHFAF